MVDNSLGAGYDNKTLNMYIMVICTCHYKEQRIKQYNYKPTQEIVFICLFILNGRFLMWRHMEISFKAPDNFIQFLSRLLVKMLTACPLYNSCLTNITIPSLIDQAFIFNLQYSCANSQPIQCDDYLFGERWLTK